MIRTSREFEAQFDLKSVLDSLEVKFLDNKTHYILDRCPNCGGRSKLYVDKKTKMWVCFRCVKTNDFSVKEGRGNLLTLMRLLGMDDGDISKLFKNGEVVHYTDPHMFSGEKPQQEEDGSVEETDLPYHFRPLTLTAEDVRENLEVYQYLFKRHVTSAEVIRSFDLRFSKEMMRLIFPVYSDKQTIVGWQGRDITDRWTHDQLKCTNNDCPTITKWYFSDSLEPLPDNFICPSCGKKLEFCHYPKSRNSKNFPKTELFFNQQNVDWKSTVTIVEGPFDCINTPNSIALLGKVISPTQLNILLERNPPEVCLYLDGDEAGRFSTSASIKLLGAFFDYLKVVPLAEGDDPGGHPLHENAQRIVSNAVPAEDWSMKYDDQFL